MSTFRRISNQTGRTVLAATAWVAMLGSWTLAPALGGSEFEDRMLRLKSGQEKGVGQIALFSEYVEVAVDNSGAFTIGNRIGDPDNPSDDNLDLLFGHPSPGSGFTSARIDNADFALQHNANVQILQAPTTNGGVNSTIWLVNDVKITQRLSLVQGNSGRLDGLSMEYELHNQGHVAKNVGLRNFFDTQLGSNDGAPFKVPGIGDVLTETERTGADVPQFFQVFDDLSNPLVQTQATLVGGMSTPPDRVVWSSWPRSVGSIFDYTIDPSVSVVFDSAYIVYWNPVSIAPGASRFIRSFYGLGDVDVEAGDPIVGLAGPASLAVSEGAYTPNPFTVSAFMSRPDEVVKGNGVPVTAEFLPTPGLELADGETALKQVGTLAPGDEGEASWQVLATGSPTGLLTYSVRGLREGGSPVVASRTIQVPPLEGGGAVIPLHAGFENGVPLGEGLVQSSIGLGDIDSDGLNEIVVGGADGSLYGYNGDGSPVLETNTKGESLRPGSLFDTPDGLGIYTSPTMADVDLDRRVDILFGTDAGDVYRLELKLTSDPDVLMNEIKLIRRITPAAKVGQRAAPTSEESDDTGR